MISQSFLIATLLYTAQSSSNDTQIETNDSRWTDWTAFDEHDMSFSAAFKGLCKAVKDGAATTAYVCKSAPILAKEAYHIMFKRKTNDTATKCRVSIHRIGTMWSHGKRKKHRVTLKDDTTGFEWKDVPVNNDMFNFSFAKNYGFFGTIEEKLDEYCRFNICRFDENNQRHYASIGLGDGTVGMPASLIPKYAVTERGEEKREECSHQDKFEAPFGVPGIEFLTVKKFRFGFYRQYRNEGDRLWFVGHEIELIHDDEQNEINKERHQLLIDYFEHMLFPESRDKLNIVDRTGWKVENNERLDNSLIPRSYFTLLGWLAHDVTTEQLKVQRDWLAEERKRVGY